MTDLWTRQRVLDLAPDVSSAKAASGLAKAAKWVTLGRSNAAVWGGIKGSGGKPYQVRVDLREPAFKCSCPSRKFPCKHALALMLVLAEEPDAIRPAGAPEWVADWLSRRSQRAKEREVRAREKAARPVDEEARARRAARREQKILAGLDELSCWLADLVCGGLAAAQTKPGSYWETAAARMVDAQAPGLASTVRELGASMASGDGWEERALALIGRLHLAINAYRRNDSLPEPMRADARSAVGWTVSTDELIAQSGVRGRWLIPGQRVEVGDRITVQSTWLLHADNPDQPALLLHFAAGSQPLDSSMIAGTAFDGELVFYPSNRPLRAIVKERGAAAPFEDFPADTLEEALRRYGTALAAQPWIDRWPMAVRDVTPAPERHGENVIWWLREAAGEAVPLTSNADVGWTLLSISGGRPIRVFGEWDGRALRPLAAASDTGLFVTGRQGARARLERVPA